MTLFADTALARRLEWHEGHGISTSMAQLRQVRPEAGSTFERVAGAYAIFAGQDSPISRTIGLGLNGPVSTADIEQVEEFYRSRHAPVQLDLCPLADASLKELLNERDYKLGEFNSLTRK